MVPKQQWCLSKKNTLRRVAFAALVYFWPVPLKKYKYLPSIVWFCAMTTLFCLPGSVIPASGFLEGIHFDKFVHAALFFILVYLAIKPMLSSTGKISGILLLISCFAIAYGIAIEFVQKNWIPNRSFDAGDIIGDSVGSIAAYVLGLQQRLKYLKK